MPDLHTLLTFVVASFVVVIVPGVTVSAVVSTGLARGFAAGLWMEAGVQVGRLTMVLVVALALEAVTGAVVAAFDIIKYAGAAYLVWFGIGYLRSHQGIAVNRPVAARSPVQQMISGFVVLWSNPKALIFFGAFLPQFVNPAYPAWRQVIVLGLIEMAAGLITDTAYIWLAANARGVLGEDRMVLVNRIAGVLLILTAVWLATQHH